MPASLCKESWICDNNINAFEYNLLIQNKIDHTTSGKYEGNEVNIFKYFVLGKFPINIL